MARKYPKKLQPNLARLKEVLHYEPLTGVFTRLVVAGNGYKPGPRPSLPRESKYGVIKLDGVIYRKHVLAWYYVTGIWPKDQIDHKDRVKHNNSFSNLREATARQNMQNIGLTSANTSGFKGVSLLKRTGRWKVGIRDEVGKMLHLGYYATAEEAGKVYADYAKSLGSRTPGAAA